MTTALVTGANGFLGRNLVAHLRNRNDVRVLTFDKHGSDDELRSHLRAADLIFHLAGVNRPEHPDEFESGNHGFTAHLCEELQRLSRSTAIVFASSIQAALDNPYGISKRRAEEALQSFGECTGARIRIYRLKNLFGKWARPDYNAVTATFCHRIAHGLPITISDPNREVELTYVDDVVRAFEAEIGNSTSVSREIPSTRISVGDLAGRLQAFHEMRETLRMTDMKDDFTRCLFATYQSYVPQSLRCLELRAHKDARGSLAEFLKSDHLGQIFVSRTRPGVTRGNHFHHSKTEKFLVLAGRGLVRLRPIDGVAIEEYEVSGENLTVLDIPPGVSHSITNVGSDDMLTLFWANEIFDPESPDTYYLPVDAEALGHNEVPIR
jgi:UDP-2-acetamido-2,6-beta-L-arabino-hexul-4-ose reductase